MRNTRQTLQKKNKCAHVLAANSVPVFCRRLKAHLFTATFGDKQHAYVRQPAPLALLLWHSTNVSKCNINKSCNILWQNLMFLFITSYSVAVDDRNQSLQTRSLDENLLYLGSSFISFLTSFHCDVSVMSAVSDSSRWNISRFFFVSALICSSCSFCFSERSRSSQSDHRWSFLSSFLLSCQEPSTLRT